MKEKVRQHCSLQNILKGLWLLFPIMHGSKELSMCEVSRFLGTLIKILEILLEFHPPRVGYRKGEEGGRK